VCVCVLHLNLLCDWLTGYRAEHAASRVCGEERGGETGGSHSVVNVCVCACVCEETGRDIYIYI